MLLQRGDLVTARIPFTPDAEENLRLLAERHQILSGMRLNWFGTYQHAAQRWLSHAEREKQWRQ